jgi:hypothetical protein
LNETKDYGICFTFFHTKLATNIFTAIGILNNIPLDYLNFQIWGSSTAQVCYIAKELFPKYNKKELASEVFENLTVL